MPTHLVTSHGADFFGQDRHQLPALISLAGYAQGVLSADDRRHLVELLEHAADGQSIEPTTAAVLADQLLRISRHRFLPAKMSATARTLADAAAQAATDGEHWEWTTATEKP
ncbi:hypothetical protein PV518_17720 [Streptomyces sp. ND04-05B]|uniref:DUF7739 domain-containing protein n=1 Tax=Streptomyces sp. ND04-05B TaxID=3028693 RepID=UPI0029ADC61B|nr:hypothetical protein [Streptomyces sp. ND04-05B]MDX3063999.1 hypothetical protein [Streptomyces sp. ND04-05B]